MSASLSQSLTPEPSRHRQAHLAQRPVANPSSPPRVPTLNTFDGRDQFATFLDNSIHPADSRPHGPETLGLLDWNRRYEVPTRVGDSGVSFLLTADKESLVGNEIVTLIAEASDDSGVVSVEIAELAIGTYDRRGRFVVHGLIDNSEVRYHHGSRATVELDLDAYLASSTSQDAVVAGLEALLRTEQVQERRRIRVRLTRSPPARFVGVSQTQIVSGSLEVAVDVEVFRAGRFVFDAKLWDADDKPIAWSRFRGRLEPGLTRANIRFAGRSTAIGRSAAIGITAVIGASLAIGFGSCKKKEAEVPEREAVTLEDAQRFGEIASQEIEATVTVETKYGYQILFADLAMIGVAAATESGAASLMYFFGSPAIHILNGNNSGAGLSLLARVVLPTAGAAIGLASAQCDSSGDEFLCGYGEVIIGAGIGLASALAIDYFVLAKKKETRRVRRTFSPTASVSGDGDLQLGIAGRF